MPTCSPGSRRPFMTTPSITYVWCVVVLLSGALFVPSHAFSELKGLRVKGCVVVEPPYVTVDEFRRTGFRGVAIEYLERMAENLQFDYELHLWNGTRQDLIDHLAVCDPGTGTGSSACECDLGVGAFSVTNKRMDKVKFVWAFGHENYHMVAHKSTLRVDDSQNAFFLFSTFTKEVWIIIFCGLIMHAIGTIFFGPFQTPEDKLPSRDKSPHLERRTKLLWQIKRFPAAVLFAYSHLIGHPFGEAMQRTPSFHRTAWLVLGLTSGLFLLTVYEASLTVVLFESTKTSPFRTLDDLKDCIVPPGRIAMVAESASQEFWNFAVNTSFVRRKCGWNRAGVLVSDFEQGFQYVAERKVDYFFDLEASILTRAHRDCETFEPVGEPFFSTSVGFMMPKRANKTVQNWLSRETRDLRERDEFDSATLIALRTSCDPVVEATITPGKLLAFFILYVIAWFLLITCRIIFLWRRRAAMPLERPHLNPEVTPPDVVVMNMHSVPTRSASVSPEMYEKEFRP